MMATGHGASGGQLGPSSNTTMLQPDKTNAVAPQRRIFWQTFFIVWSPLALPESIFTSRNDPNRIFLRLISKETTYMAFTRTPVSRHELQFANSQQGIMVIGR
jgi:hypothetical protein